MSEIKLYEVYQYTFGGDAPYFSFLCHDEEVVDRIRDKTNNANLFLRERTLSRADVVERWLDDLNS